MKTAMRLITDCFTSETPDPAAGMPLGLAAVVAALPHPTGEPRDAMTVLRGVPVFQPRGQAARLHLRKARGRHAVVFTGSTLETLGQRQEPDMHEALRLTDPVSDSPCVRSLTGGAGVWSAVDGRRWMHGSIVHNLHVLQRAQDAPMRRRRDFCTAVLDEMGHRWWDGTGPTHRCDQASLTATEHSATHVGPIRAHRLQPHRRMPVLARSTRVQ